MQDKNEELEILMTAEKVENRRIQTILENKVRELTSENRNLQNSLDTFAKKIGCEGPIFESNGLRLLKNQSEIQICQEYGIYDEPENSILIFTDASEYNKKAVITRGLSTRLDKADNSFKIGNKDKIITSFNPNQNFEFILNGACGVLYQGLIHFLVVSSLVISFRIFLSGGQFCIFFSKLVRDIDIVLFFRNPVMSDDVIMT